MSKAKHYVSTKPTTAPGFYVPAGQSFVAETDKPSDDWEEVSPKAAAAIESSTNQVPDDADLDALTKAPLQAVAFMRHVAGIADLDADGLKDAIRASYEPKL